MSSVVVSGTSVGTGISASDPVEITEPQEGWLDWIARNAYESADASARYLWKNSDMIATAIAQGITFGNLDELQGFVDSVTMGIPYEEAVKPYRAKLEQYREEAPAIMYPAEIGGSMLPMSKALGTVQRGIRSMFPARTTTQAATAAPKITPSMVGSDVTKAAVGGGIYGMGESEKVIDPEAFAGGALFGAATQYFIPPAASMAAKELKKRGMKLSVGQQMGGMVQRAEEKMTSIPFVGDALAMARDKAFKQFPVIAYNEALEPLGKKLPPMLTPRKAYEDAQKIIDDAFNALKTDDVAVNFTPELKANLKKELQSFSGKIKSSDLADIEEMVTYTIFEKLKGRNTMTANELIEVKSELGDLAQSFAKQGDAQKYFAVDGITDILLDEFSKNQPKLGADYEKLRTAYAKFKPLVVAGESAGVKNMAFTPAQLKRAIQKSSKGQKKQYRLGDRPMQAFAEQAEEVLGGKVPDSGTAGRLMLGQGLIGGGTAGMLAVDPSNLISALPLMGAGALIAPSIGQPIMRGTQIPIGMRGKKLNIEGLLTGGSQALKSPAVAGMVGGGLLESDYLEGMSYPQAYLLTSRVNDINTLEVINYGKERNYRF